MFEISIDPSSRSFQVRVGTGGSRSHRSVSKTTKKHYSRQPHKSHTAQRVNRGPYEHGSTPEVPCCSTYCGTDSFYSAPYASQSPFDGHGVNLNCQQCFDAETTHYTNYYGSPSRYSYQQTTPLMVPPPIPGYAIPPPGPVPYSQPYGFSPQTPNYPRGSDYRSRENTSHGYRDTAVSEQQSRGRKCIFCGNRGLNLTVEKDGEILHPYIVQRDTEGHTWLAGDGDSLAEAHGVACMAHMDRLRELWVEACDAKDQFVEFYPRHVSGNRWYLFASREACGKYYFFEVDIDVESVV